MKLFHKHKKSGVKKTQQSGFSLIELMIASTLGLFVIGGVVTTFIGTKDSEQMRSAVSEMDANARTAIEVLRKTISLAGYSSMRNIQDFNKPFYSERDEADLDAQGSVNRFCGGGAIRMNDDDSTPRADEYTADSNEITGRSDVLTAVYLADNPCNAGSPNCPNLVNVDSRSMIYTDCAGGGATRDARTVSCSTEKSPTGMPISGQAKIYNTFYLGAGGNNRTLMCRGSRGGTTPLVDNVEYLQFLYGVTHADGTTEFLNADNVEVTDVWEYVTSVRVGLLMRSSRENILATPSTKNSYLLLDRNVPVADMRRLYRVYTTTIILPNRNRGNVI